MVCKSVVGKNRPVADLVGVPKLVAFHLAGVDDLRGDVLGGQGRPEQLVRAASGGKGGGAAGLGAASSG